jgi:hypothetical protein
MAERSILDAILAQGGGSAAIHAIEELFPKDYNKKKMVTEIRPELMFPLVVLGTVQRKFKSRVLKTFDDEFLTRMKSLDRKGEIALVSVLLSVQQEREALPGPLD